MKQLIPGGPAVALVAVAIAMVLPAPAFAMLTFDRTDYSSAGVSPSAIATTISPDYASVDPDPVIAVANRDSDTVEILLHNQLGTYLSAGPALSVGDQPVALAFADFNNDNLADLAVANRGAIDSISILTGDGFGGFTLTSTLTSIDGVGTDPSAIAALNVTDPLDADTDLVIANAGSDDISVLLGDGLGGFTVSAASPVAVGDEPVALAVDPWEQHSAYVANRSGDSVSTISDVGSTPSVQTTSTGAGSAPAAVAEGPDRTNGPITQLVAVANSGSGTLSIFDNSPPLAPLVGSPFSSGTAPSGIATGPFGANFLRFDEAIGSYNSVLTDFAVTDGAADSVRFTLGEGNLDFQTGVGSVATGDGPAAIIEGDFDVDGRAGDIATANLNAGTVTVLLNTHTPGWSAAPATMSFSQQPRYTLSDAQTATATNTGGTPISIGRVQLLGANPGDFVIADDQCNGYRIPAGFDAGCGVRIRFAPTATGVRSATLRLTDQFGDLQNVTLSGTGGDLPAGPTGPAGSDGSDGAPGQAGPAEPAGATTARLQAAFALTKLSARPRKSFQVRYVITTAASVRIEVLKGKRVISLIRQSAAGAGRRSAKLRVNRAGRYGLRLTTTGSDGQSSIDNVRLTVR